MWAHLSKLGAVFLVIGVLVGMLLASGVEDRANSADWPLFRGNPFQTGVAVSGLPEQLEIRWEFKTKEGIEATAAIVGDTVYVGSLDEHVYALDLSTGKQKWNYKSGAIKAPASVRRGLVYIGDLDGVFHCIDAANGRKRWSYDTTKQGPQGEPGGEIASGANFAGDNVLFGCGDETLYCLDSSGKARWKFKVPGGPVLGSPAIVGKRTFAAGCDSTLHVIDTDTGTEVGSGVDLGGQVGATVGLVGVQLYVGTMSCQVLAINWQKGQIEWTFEAANRRQPFFASAAVTDTLVIAGSRDKRVYALDRKTGKEIWNFATRGRVESSPVVVGKRVFAASLDGNLYMLDLEKGTELKRFHLGDSITASPAVAGNSLVISSDNGVVYCLGEKK